MRMLSISILLTISFATMAIAGGCGGSDKTPEKKVVIYTSVDDPVARPILQEFEKRTGIAVVLVTDAEASKTAGLAAKLEAEKANPQADVYWGNEPFYTINLADKRVLASYESPAAASIPAMYKDAKGLWASSGLRVRVLGLADSGQGAAKIAAVKGIADLLNPELKGRIAMARPSVGTTGGHVAALYVLLGHQKARQLLTDLKKNDIKLLGGNSEVVKYILSGQIWAGLTDNDDVVNAQQAGGKVTMRLPDQDAHGTLAVPTTVALVAGAKHAENARKLIDYLLSEEVEKQMIAAGFAKYSVRADAKEVKPMAVDYRAVAAKMPQAINDALGILEGRK